jgi:hypothetical protein
MESVESAELSDLNSRLIHMCFTIVHVKSNWLIGFLGKLEYWFVFLREPVLQDWKEKTYTIIYVCLPLLRMEQSPVQDMRGRIVNINPTTNDW